MPNPFWDSVTGRGGGSLGSFIMLPFTDAPPLSEGHQKWQHDKTAPKGIS